MKRVVWSCGVLATIALLLVPPRAALGQGVSSAAVAGRITDESGAPVPAAQLTLINGSTGQRYAARSRDDGRYSFENVDVGGPYTLGARALGFEPKTGTPFNLQLGQRLALDLSLKRAAVELAGVIVETSSNPLLSTARTGAGSFISDSALRRLPTLNRAFNDFVNTAPQIVKTPGGGTSFTGQNDRFNNIQIDGTVNNDLFALGASNQIPGGGVNARPLSIEAVKEYQVLTAPFDVRQGGFVGGLINAVTKSGTNQFHGSVFGYMQNENFVGSDTNGVSVPVADYQQQQYGFTFGGPIIRDRLHFFVTSDFRHDNRPFATSIQLGANGDTTGVGITQARFDSVQQILTTQYGFDPGTWRAPQINNPETNLFGKFDLELSTNSHLEVSGTLINVNQDKMIHTYRSGFVQPPSLSNARDGYELSGSGYYMKDETRTLRGKWTTTFGNNLSNELIVGRTAISDNRPPVSNHPLILVGGNSPGTYIAAGAERFSHANSLDQRVVEVTDNVTFSVGRHLLTVGTHNEFIHFRNVFFPASIGIWNFATPAALAAGTPNFYARALPGLLRPDGPVADFDVTQVGFYGEDRFSPVPNLTLTAGLRMDVPSVPAPAFNTALDTGVAFPALGGGGVDTRSSPSGNILWSPRLGFNYDVNGRQETIVRGGVGIFSGRPPYVWVSNAYGNTGLEQRTLLCNGVISGGSPGGTDTVPTFTVDPNAQPRKCGAGGPTSDSASAAATSIVFYDQNFKFPQALKLALGVDRALPWNLFATVDFIYTKAINQYYLEDINLRGIQGASAGEAGRPLYGTINPATGGATVQRVTNRANDIVMNRNVSKDQSTSLAFQLQKRFSDGLEFSAAYTYSHSLDVMSMTSDITSSNYNFAALDGTIANRNLRTSSFDRPNKVTISGTVNAPFGARFSLIYNGVSGTPLTYVVSGDANADGVFGNDLVYVPRNRADMTTDGNGGSVAGFGTAAQQDSVFGLLDSYINNEPCLRDNRGRLLPRNSCRNPWQNYLNARLSWAIPTVSGHTLEITADMLNVLNFINSGWGLIRQTGTGFEEQNLIQQTGYDAANGRGIYALAIPTKNAVTINSIGSRWVFQLGTRYTF
jgi:hypothetical protein